MSNELQIFNYNQLDQNTADYLQELEKEGMKASNEFIFTWGNILIKGQEKLKKGKYGCFMEWINYLGFSQSTAQNYMNVTKNLNLQQLQIKDLPKKLLYEISKPSANQELKQKVLDGEITNHKDYKEIESKLKQVEEEKKKLEQELQKEKNKAVKVETKVIEREVDNTDYETINKLNKQLQQKEKSFELLMNEKKAIENKMRLTEKENQDFQNLKQQIHTLMIEKEDIGRQIEAATSISGLVVEIDHLIKEKLAPVKYSKAIQEMQNDEIVIQNLTQIIGTVQSWCDDMKKYLPNTRKIIDVEVM